MWKLLTRFDSSSNSAGTVGRVDFRRRRSDYCLESVTHGSHQNDSKSREGLLYRQVLDEVVALEFFSSLVSLLSGTIVNHMSECLWRRVPEMTCLIERVVFERLVVPPPPVFCLQKFWLQVASYARCSRQLIGRIQEISSYILPRILGWDRSPSIRKFDTGSNAYVSDYLISASPQELLSDTVIDSSRIIRDAEYAIRVSFSWFLLVILGQVGSKWYSIRDLTKEI